MYYIKTYRNHPWLSGILFPKVARFMKNMPNISPQNDMDHLMLSAPSANLFSQLVDSIRYTMYLTTILLRCLLSCKMKTQILFLVSFVRDSLMLKGK